MAIPESQLQTWSHQGSKTQSASTYQTIRNVLEDPEAPFHSKSYNIFRQGSYGNDTNIYADSDVDIVMCLTSVYYDDTSSLDEAEKQRYKANFSPAAYTYSDFKGEVLARLTYKFGKGVKAGKKAIFVPGNGVRRDADVLVCAEHRSYSYYSSGAANYYREGITFWAANGEQIINYPKQHMQNCTTKHQSTNSRFKNNVRVLKNMRNTMIDRGYIEVGLAPSYFIEGMLSNVSNQSFVSSYQQTFLVYMHWLQSCQSQDLTCANDIHYLLREGHSVCWRTANFKEFRAAAMRFWNDW